VVKLCRGLAQGKEVEMSGGFLGFVDAAVVERLRECNLDRSKKIYVVRNCCKMAFLHHT
jgi:preprotein translocase subunit YajC